MNVHELRIGNYVTDQWNSTPSIVTSINEKGIDLEIEDDGNWAECAKQWIEATTKSEEIFGVPLTEEILMKCGAEKGIENVYEQDRFILQWLEKYKYWYVTNLQGVYITKVEFVHEWQNTWFVLQGQELTVQL